MLIVGNDKSFLKKVNTFFSKSYFIVNIQDTVEALSRVSELNPSMMIIDFYDDPIGEEKFLKILSGLYETCSLAIFCSTENKNLLSYEENFHNFAVFNKPIDENFFERVNSFHQKEKKEKRREMTPLELKLISALARRYKKYQDFMLSNAGKSYSVFNPRVAFEERDRLKSNFDYLLESIFTDSHSRSTILEKLKFTYGTWQDKVSKQKNKFLKPLERQLKKSLSIPLNIDDYDKIHSFEKYAVYEKSSGFRLELDGKDVTENILAYDDSEGARILEIYWMIDRIEAIASHEGLI